MFQIAVISHNDQNIPNFGLIKLNFEMLSSHFDYVCPYEHIKSFFYEIYLNLKENYNCSGYLH
jgi:hypothetical protein